MMSTNKAPTNSVSATIVAYNEQEKISACLQSIKNAVDEIIVVHDGPCKDNTLKICEKYGSRIFKRPHIGEAEPHRLFSFKKAKGNWILQIDADERLSQEAQKKLHELTNQNTIDAYAFRWEDPEEVKILGLWPIKKYKPILFRKNKIKFTGLVHEPTGTSGKLTRTELVLEHNPSPMSDPMVFRRKTRHWASVAAETLIKRKLAEKPAVFYLIKAPVWAALYFFIYFILKLHILGGKNGWTTTKYHATYNFLKNYYIYKLNKKCTNSK